MYARATLAVASGRRLTDDSSPIFEGVHLFANYVGIRSDGSREELRFLEDREANFAEVVGLENVAGSLLEPIPKRGIGRKDIASAFDGAELALLSHGCGASRGG